jgi:hypothetical protein
VALLKFGTIGSIPHKFIESANELPSLVELFMSIVRKVHEWEAIRSVINEIRRPGRTPEKLREKEITESTNTDIEAQCDTLNLLACVRYMNIAKFPGTGHPKSKREHDHSQDPCVRVYRVKGSRRWIYPPESYTYKHICPDKFDMTVHPAPGLRD